MCGGSHLKIRITELAHAWTEIDAAHRPLYESGSGSTVLTFRHTVLAAESDSNGIGIGNRNIFFPSVQALKMLRGTLWQ